MKTTVSRIFVILGMAALSSCGFHLAGAPNAIIVNHQAWQLDGGALQQPLERMMHYHHLTITDNAPTRLNVLSMQTRKDIYTITHAAKLNEYLLSLRVHAQAYRNDKAWGAPITVHIRRTLPYTDSLVLGKQEEENMIWQEMKQDAAEQIIRRLTFLKD